MKEESKKEIVVKSYPINNMQDTDFINKIKDRMISEMDEVGYELDEFKIADYGKLGILLFKFKLKGSNQ